MGSYYLLFTPFPNHQKQNNQSDKYNNTHESAISCFMLASSVMAMPLPLAAVAALLVFSLSADLVNCQRYIVPEARLEFQNPRGLKISIPGKYLLNLQILVF